MKNSIAILLILGVMVSVISCKKDSKTSNNFFSFLDKNYTINEGGIIDITFDEGTTDEVVVHTIFFVNISGNDTTQLMISVFDVNDATLGGTYQSLSQEESGTADRGTLPFTLLANSMITFQDGTGYLTGHGGSIDISNEGSNYTININSISAGNYTDFFDIDENDDFGYVEEGIIKGSFEGVLMTYSLSGLKKDKETRCHELIDKIIRK